MAEVSALIRAGGQFGGLTVLTFVLLLEFLDAHVPRGLLRLVALSFSGATLHVSTHAPSTCTGHPDLSPAAVGATPHGGSCDRGRARPSGQAALPPTEVRAGSATALQPTSAPVDHGFPHPLGADGAVRLDELIASLGRRASGGGAGAIAVRARDRTGGGPAATLALRTALRRVGKVRAAALMQTFGAELVGNERTSAPESGRPGTRDRA